MEKIQVIVRSYTYNPETKKCKQNGKSKSKTFKDASLDSVFAYLEAYNDKFEEIYP